MMNGAIYIVHVFMYSIILLALWAVPLLAVMNVIDWLDSSPWRFTLYPVVAVLYLAMLASGWMAHNAARRRALEDEGFMESLGNAYDEGKIYLSCIPMLTRLGLFVSSRRRSGRTEDRDRRFDNPNQS